MDVLKVIVFASSAFMAAFGKDEPHFSGSGSNVTVVAGRDASLVCTVDNLAGYKVAWLREDTQTILTIGAHVITKNHRVAVGKLDPQTWALTIRDIRPSDAGFYMCQINTEPMITQTHILQVAVPPDIEDTSSGEVLSREGDAVSLRCVATGVPPPVINWRREDLAPIHVGGQTVNKWNGEWLNLTDVSREVSGALLCIASNGVPPSVSKRILLKILCKPSVRLVPKMIGGYLEGDVDLQCQIEAFPIPVVYWTHLGTIRLPNGLKYQAIVESEGYRHKAHLRIHNISRDDIGSYHCHAENSLGNASDDVTLYTLATTTTAPLPTISETTPLDVTTTIPTHREEDDNQAVEDKDLFDEDNYVVVLSQHQMQNLDLSPSS